MIQPPQFEMVRIVSTADETLVGRVSTARIQKLQDAIGLETDKHATSASFVNMIFEQMMTPFVKKG